VSENTGWGDTVETRPVAVSPVLTVEAQVARMRDREQRRQPLSDSPMLRRFSPRRNVWPEVAAYDERARELERRAAALNDEIAARGEARKQAVEADRDALAEWQLRDGKGRRPEPTAPAIEQEIEAKTADRDAALAAAERVFEDKASFVEKNRRRLIREADKGTREAHGRYTEALEAAEQARAELVDCRSAALWASLFPSELANQLPDTAAVAANLRKPVEAALQLKTRLPADGVFRVLRSDAEILAEAMTRDQALELGAADPHHDAAIWQGTPEHQKQMRKEREEARERLSARMGQACRLVTGAT
jgi:hypothetical protein